ncbi:MAG: nuclease [Pseudomonadota bacterium]
MSDPLQILWTPAGVNLPSLGARSLVDVSDGDTPNIRMPIRMLSIDTPEVTAGSERGAARVDGRFAELVGWIEQGIAPVSLRFRDHILPRLTERQAGTLQYEQGKAASAFHATRVDERLRRPNGRRRNLFVRSADQPFDGYGRLLAYVAPSYSSRELRALTRRERPTFNLDLVESGWAAPFIIFPSIPGELDLPIFVEKAVEAETEKRGQYADALSLPGYEYRMCEKLYAITKKIAGGDDLSYPDRIAWRTRYCADMRSRMLHGPEDYMAIPPAYRLWLWPEDVQRAIGMLNLVPSGALTD